MKIDDQKLEIASLPFDEKGQKLEPEEQPAKIVQTGAAPIAHGGIETGSGLPITIENHLTAGALAATVRDPCGTCKHFNRTAWRSYVKRLSGSYEGRQKLNAVMAELIMQRHMDFQEMHRSPVDGEFDTDHAVNSLAFCNVLTEVHAEEIVVHPLGVCPPEMRSFERPRGSYEARDGDTEKAGAKAFDSVMRAAQKGEKI